MAHAAYGPAHQRRRKQLMAAHVDHHARTGVWRPCARCRKPLVPDPLLPADGIDLGHSESWMKQQGMPGDQLEHAHCNRSYGDGSRVDWFSTDW